METADRPGTNGAAGKGQRNMKAGSIIGLAVLVVLYLGIGFAIASTLSGLTHGGFTAKEKLEVTLFWLFYLIRILL